MSSTKYKIIYIIFWIFLISFIIFTIWTRIPPKLKNYDSPIFWLNLVQRILALLSFTGLSMQIILGAFLKPIAYRFGSWIYKLHIVQGPVIYTLILGHVSSYLAILTITGSFFESIFYILLGVCLLCEVKTELFYSFGRIGFWLITIAVIFAKFRTIMPFVRRWWRQFHILNYFVFFLVAVHSFVVGSDIVKSNYHFIYWSAVGLVSITAIYKLLYLIKNNLKFRLR